MSIFKYNQMFCSMQDKHLTDIFLFQFRYLASYWLSLDLLVHEDDLRKFTDTNKPEAKTAQKR